MSLYKYEAKSLDGKRLKGTIEGKNELEIRKNLRAKGYYATNISSKSSGLNIEIELFNKIEYSDYSVLCRELYFSISSGVPILEALEMVTNGAENKKLKRILENVYKEVEKGKLLSESLKRHSEVPNLLWSMVEVGEETGNLEEIMYELSEYYHKQYEQKKKINGALLYPKFLFAFAMIVVSFLVIYIVPLFVRNLMSSNGKMPLPTKIVMWTSNFLGNYWIYILIFILIVVAIKKLFLNKNKKYIYLRDKYIIQSRFFGNITKLIITARFSRTFSILFTGGVSVIKCFEITANVIGNSYVSEKILESKEMINKGESIGESLEFYNILPKMIIKTIKIGEKTGSLDKILKKSSSYYESEANFKLDKLTKMIEPAMIIILAFIVGFIVVSIMMPIFAMYNAVG